MTSKVTTSSSGWTDKSNSVSSQTPNSYVVPSLPPPPSSLFFPLSMPFYLLPPTLYPPSLCPLPPFPSFSLLLPSITPILHCLSLPLSPLLHLSSSSSSLFLLHRSPPFSFSLSCLSLPPFFITPILLPLSSSSLFLLPLSSSTFSLSLLSPLSSSPFLLPSSSPLLPPPPPPLLLPHSRLWLLCSNHS